MMANAEFKPGDLVVLKSGGPRMTIEFVNSSDPKIGCVWFSESTNQFYNKAFYRDAIRLITEADKAYGED
jgi:uncharacterized protein YodC (DUF2158 family)